MVAPLDDEQLWSEALLHEYFNVRVGNYRVLYDIIDERLVVLVLAIGHRREIYRRRR